MQRCHHQDVGYRGFTWRTGSYCQMLFSACSVTQLAPPMMYMSLPAVRVCAG